MHEHKGLGWVYNLKEETILFLCDMRGERRKGFFRYSWTGDYLSESVKWGLGNSVFFLKIVYVLNLQQVFKKEVNEAVDFIKSFQDKKGVFHDNLLDVLALPLCMKSFVRKFNISCFSRKKTIVAETRQAFSSLSLFGVKANYQYYSVPRSEKEAVDFLSKLDWEKPWGAGSHFSHLLYFLNSSDLKNKDQLISFAISWVNKLQSNNDGFWYSGNPTIQQKINGAMKVITALKVANKTKFNFSDRLLNSVLTEKNNNKHACDNFNTVYVLRRCLENTGSNYHADEVKKFARSKLKEYHKYYYPKLGGFSFYKGKSNRFYLGSLISKGRDEPDIHGTVMFLWGISIILQLLDMDKKLGFKEFAT